MSDPLLQRDSLPGQSHQHIPTPGRGGCRDLRGSQGLTILVEVHKIWRQREEEARVNLCRGCSSSCPTSSSPPVHPTTAPGRGDLLVQWGTTAGLVSGSQGSGCYGSMEAERPIVTSHVSPRGCRATYRHTLAPRLHPTVVGGCTHHFEGLPPPSHCPSRQVPHSRC